ncbi:hypothetical protein RhiirC2_734977 [Rhizophagus irregularis]|uniref:Uncharacterized protein n=1 Tax=Rhizophagus irregularis TaxID=588596 RepID=A0A2N1NQL8_9GLOM|nr:hypothetical protein RhiirC2_734977 [Rhizophagus irregularis]
MNRQKRLNTKFIKNKVTIPNHSLHVKNNLMDLILRRFLKIWAIQLSQMITTAMRMNLA